MRLASKAKLRITQSAFKTDAEIFASVNIASAPSAFGRALKCAPSLEALSRPGDGGMAKSGRLAEHCAVITIQRGIDSLQSLAHCERLQLRSLPNRRV